MKSLLAINNLTKSYGAVYAVKNVSFHLRNADIVGLVGPNGAGKTTTISMITGIVEPTSGSIQICGSEITSRNRQILNHVGFAGSYAHLPENLTVYQNLLIFAHIYNLPFPEKQTKDALDRLKLTAVAHQKLGNLSSGWQIRVSIAKALINRPSLLILDEPTASLDPISAAFIRKSIKEYIDETNAAILWTSHNLSEIESVCDRVLFMVHGRVIAEGRPYDLLRTHKKKTLEELFFALSSL